MKGKEVGKVINYFEHVGVAAVELKSPVKLGDTLRFVGGERDFTEVVDSIQIHGKKVEKAKAGDAIGVKVSDRVRKGYRVFKVE
jgi:translation elongation factor EF-Tu-like GTPase